MPKENTEKEKTIVMVIEDEELLLKAVERKLLMSGMEVIRCTSAEEAIMSLKSSSKLPDVIWLDYYLKDMNGLDFMNLLKTNLNWATIPVMVVSNSASIDKVDKMMKLGVKRYVLKAESRLEDLLKVLNEISQDNQEGEK